MSAKPGVAGGARKSCTVARAGRWGERKTLGQAFDPRSNALNAWRLTLALGVIFWHCYFLTGRNIPFAPGRQLLGEIWVDAFFAISGFLITASWLSKPRVRDYFIARALRILPGFYTCLIVTAFVVAPIGLALQGGSPKRLLLSGAPFEYIVKNSAVFMFQYDVGGTPRGIPWHAWNVSLWTLGWEVVCYIGVAVVGVAGLLNRRWFLPAATTLCWFALLLTTLVLPPSMPHDCARFVMMFLAGALMHQYRGLISARWSLVVVSVVVVLLASLLPDYRLVAAIPLAYAVIVSGALLHNRRLRLVTDLSYGVYIYACPIQQLLILNGFRSINPLAFYVVAAAASLPVALLSWALVEKPALSLKSRVVGRAEGRLGRTGERLLQGTQSFK